MQPGNYWRRVFENHELRNLAAYKLENVHMRIVEGIPKPSSTLTSTRKRPDALWHRMLRLEIIVKQGKKPFLVAAFERRIGWLH
ncbi:MAG: hypothetical protein JO166_16550 [Deltaproteobacteria bacterium]|nr:hypothetical protein [Deltaproteobacteria bacterium]